MNIIRREGAPAAGHPGRFDVQHPPQVEFQGYLIVTKPDESGGKWYGGYELVKDGSVVRSRNHIYPGFFYFDAACEDSIEHAKLEIENLGGGSDELH
ncbi:MAG: fructosamine kinase family protein [Herminiimonas sp.]|nr:fructosamine kinase family protein [Herminiimonas sp.]